MSSASHNRPPHHLHRRGPHGKHAQAVARRVPSQLHQHIAAVRAHALRQLRLWQPPHLAEHRAGRLAQCMLRSKMLRSLKKNLDLPCRISFRHRANLATHFGHCGSHRAGWHLLPGAAGCRDSRAQVRCLGVRHWHAAVHDVPYPVATPAPQRRQVLGEIWPASCSL